MDYFELLKHRRSTRKFETKQITEGELSKLLFAANAAPVGSNLYKDVHLTVVQNRDILNTLAEAARRRLSDKKTMREITSSVDDPALELLGEKKAHDPFYGAPTVLFVSHRRQELQPSIEWANALCVALSMHLAAVDQGLGSVFMWGVLEAMRVIPELDNTAVLNLPENFEPLVGLAVGYPVAPLAAREVSLEKIAVNYL